MKHQHKPGCHCAECLDTFEQRVNAAQQFYQLLNLRWIGMRAATAYADFAVAMPLRAFLFSLVTLTTWENERDTLGRNALAGVFVFSPPKP